MSSDDDFSDDESFYQQELEEKMRSYVRAGLKYIEYKPQLEKALFYSVERRESIAKNILAKIIWDLRDRPSAKFDPKEKFPNGMTGIQLFEDVLVMCWEIYPNESWDIVVLLDHIAEEFKTSDIVQLEPRTLATLKAISLQKETDFPIKMIISAAKTILSRVQNKCDFGGATMHALPRMLHSINKRSEETKNPEVLSPEWYSNIVQSHAEQIQFLRQTKDGDTRTLCSNRTCSKISTFEIPFKRCSGCKKVFYCSPECQKEDWKEHKKQCIPVKTQK